MRHKNPNTTALTSAMQSDLPSLREEARRLIVEAAALPTIAERAKALGVNERTFYRLVKLLPEPPAMG